MLTPGFITYFQTMLILFTCFDEALVAATTEVGIQSVAGTDLANINPADNAYSIAFARMTKVMAHENFEHDPTGDEFAIVIWDICIGRLMHNAL